VERIVRADHELRPRCLQAPHGVEHERADAAPLITVNATHVRAQVDAAIESDGG